jgi:hypothetical protein
MKRSEFVSKLHDHETPWATQIVELAEAAGVVWDPEEPELPERLRLTEGCWYIDSVDGPDDCRMVAEVDGTSRRAVAIAAEAVRRYNLWRELRQFVLDRRHGAICDCSVCDALDNLDAILNGEP